MPRKLPQEVEERLRRSSHILALKQDPGFVQAAETWARQNAAQLGWYLRAMDASSDGHDYLGRLARGETFADVLVDELVGYAELGSDLRERPFEEGARDVDPAPNLEQMFPGVADSRGWRAMLATVEKAAVSDGLQRKLAEGDVARAPQGGGLERMRADVQRARAVAAANQVDRVEQDRLTGLETRLREAEVAAARNRARVEDGSSLRNVIDNGLAAEEARVSPRHRERQRIEHLLAQGVIGPEVAFAMNDLNNQAPEDLGVLAAFGSPAPERPEFESGIRADVAAAYAKHARATAEGSGRLPALSTRETYVPVDEASRIWGAGRNSAVPGEPRQAAESNEVAEAREKRERWVFTSRDERRKDIEAAWWVNAVPEPGEERAEAPPPLDVDGHRSPDHESMPVQQQQSDDLRATVAAAFDRVAGTESTEE